MTLYWAYGSNLDPVGMRRRCPSAKRIGALPVDGGALVFRSVADVVTREDSVVPGAVWRITRTDEAELDIYEGVSHGLYAKKYLRLKVNGVSEDCLYYQMVCERGIMPPPESYLETIIRGYEYFDLDLAILNKAVAESWSDKRLSPYLRDRYERKGRPPMARKIKI